MTLLVRALLRRVGMERFDPDTTLVRHGRDAITLSDMVDFVRDLEERPIVRLLDEIPLLAVLSDAKFSLARLILRRRFRLESPVEQLQIQAMLEEIAAGVGDTAVADRVRSIFAPERA